ncbi:MAG: hypothetical protein JNL45_05620 [Hyphomicrobium sp.]|nr:hypothetical protein [Hyphomicrobium sp.]
MTSRLAVLALILLGLTATLGSGGAARANWLTSLTKGVSKAGKEATHLHPHLGDLGKAIGHLPHTPPGTRAAALAAHAAPEGHWKFANRDGTVFTAGTPDEMQRLLPSLAPDAAGEGKLALYLTEDSVFANRAALDKLPDGAELHLSTAEGAFALMRAADGALSLKLKPNVTIVLGERAMFEEALAFLSRPLNRSSIRTLSIEPGEAKALSSAPQLDSATKAPLIDKVAPERLEGSLRALRGQTALIVGRIENGKIAFKPSSGGEVASDLDELLAAAREADVNLVLLNAGTPLQPGGRNWLWQSIEVGGLDDAMSKATFGDFLDAIGARRAPMTVSAASDGAGRVHLKAQAGEAGGAVEAAQGTLADLMGHVTGEVISNTLDIHARDQSSQLERDARIVPGIPTYIQMPYLVSVIGGLLGWPVSRTWWSRIWPPRSRAQGESWISHRLKGLPNFLVYLLAFLPIAGLPAFIWHGLVHLWTAVSAPFRWLRRVLRRRVEV